MGLLPNIDSKTAEIALSAVNLVLAYKKILFHLKKKKEKYKRFSFADMFIYLFIYSFIYHRHRHYCVIAPVEVLVVITRYVVIILKCLTMIFYLFSTIKGIDNIVMKVILDDGAFMLAEKKLGAAAVRIEFGQNTGMILTRLSTYSSDNSTVRYCLLCHVYVGFYTPEVGCMMKTI